MIFLISSLYGTDNFYASLKNTSLWNKRLSHECVGHIELPMFTMRQKCLIISDACGPQIRPSYLPLG